MFGPSWKTLLIGGVVAATLAMGVSQADACWRCGGYYPVSWGYTAYYTPSYTSCCTVSYDPCCSTSCGWYVGYRPGPLRRLLFGRYRWYYGCWGGYSSYDWGTCCTEVGVMAPAAPAQPTPAEVQKPVLGEQPAKPPVTPPTMPAEPTTPPPTTPNGPEPAVEPPAKAPEPPADTAPSTLRTRENSGLLTIYVPYDAKITVNGLTTRSKGSRRQYVSYGLKSGFGYRYVIHVQAMTRVRENPDDPYSPLVNRLVEREKEVVLTAGDRKMVTFGFNPAPSQEVASR